MRVDERRIYMLIVGRCVGIERVNDRPHEIPWRV